MENPIDKLAPFLPLPMLFLLPFILFFISSGEAGWANSLDPKLFLSASHAPEMLIASFGYFFVVAFLVKSKAAIPSFRMALYATSELPLLLGFALAIADKNAFLIAPFMLFSILYYAYIFLKVREVGRSN
jgi:hypothetical protein